MPPSSASCLLLLYEFRVVLSATRPDRQGGVTDRIPTISNAF